MISRRSAPVVVTIALALTGLAGCQSNDELHPDRLVDVDWTKFLSRCPIGEPRGFGMKIDEIIKGEVTGDRYPDTLVVDSCDSPTASNPQMVEVFDGSSDPASPRRLGILLERDPDYPRSVKVRVGPDRTILVEATGLQPDSPRCCPDLTIVASFRWQDGKFANVSRTATPF